MVVQQNADGWLRRHAAICPILVVHVALLLWGAISHSPTVDEVAYLPAGISHWTLGRFELYAVNPPLVRMVAALPVLAMEPQLNWDLHSTRISSRSEFAVGREFVRRNGKRALTMYSIGRIACIPFSVLGAYLCFCWASRIYGPRAGLAAGVFWCFSPSILANAQLLTPDTAATSLGLLAVFALRSWLIQPCWLKACLFGAATGAAILAKATWLVLMPVLVLIVVPIWQYREILCLQVLLRDLRHFGIAVIVSLYVINTIYGFDGTFRRLDSLEFTSRALTIEDSESKRFTNRFEGSPIGSLPVPLPANMLQGIDAVKKEFETGHRSYLMGEWKHGGWLHYYLVAVLVKVPLAVWAVGFVSILSRMLPGVRVPLREELLLLIPGLLVFGLVSSQTGFNHHMRYVLPSFPFAFVLISRAAHCRLRIVKIFVCTCCVWLAGVSLWFAPHWLSFFNLAAGGPMKGHDYLVDSNIDWGQDLLYLRDWLQRHPEARPLRMAYFGYMSPEDIGIEYSLPPTWVADADISAHPDMRTGPQPGWYAISVCQMKGLHFTVPNGKGGLDYSRDGRYTWFQYLKPVATAGYSIYHVSDDDVERVHAILKSERGLKIP